MGDERWTYFGPHKRHSIEIAGFFHICSGKAPEAVAYAVSVECASRIVKAVNAHDALVSALKASRSFVELVYDETDGEEAADAKLVMSQIDAILARTES